MNQQPPETTKNSADKESYVYIENARSNIFLYEDTRGCHELIYASTFPEKSFVHDDMTHIETHQNPLEM